MGVICFFMLLLVAEIIVAGDEDYGEEAIGGMVGHTSYV